MQLVGRRAVVRRLGDAACAVLAPDRGADPATAKVREGLNKALEKARKAVMRIGSTESLAFARRSKAVVILAMAPAAFSKVAVARGDAPRWARMNAITSLALAIRVPSSWRSFDSSACGLVLPCGGLLARVIPLAVCLRPQHATIEYARTAARLEGTNGQTSGHEARYG